MRTVIARFGEVSIGEALEMSERYSQEHPGCRVYLDGDMRAIVAEEQEAVSP